MKLTKEIQDNLLTPFDESEVKFKPAAVKDGKALALAYVDARTILDRLDNTVGIENWHDEYQVISPRQVVCKLTIMGITKSDAGEATEGEKEPLKSAISDALKRAAVKFGVGRYLYRVPRTWCKFDNSRNEFFEKPDMNGGVIQKKIDKKDNIESLDKEEEEIEIPQCADCSEKITNRVAIFSQKYYQRPLCMKCQSALIQKAN